MTPLIALTMLPLAAAAVPAVQQQAGVASEQPVTAIVATFDRSEWTPPGTVSLDLGSGRYELTPAPSRRQHNFGPPVVTTSGRIDGAELASIREAFEAASARGLEAPSCELIVSNAGPLSLRLVRDGVASTTPERGCWSEAARNLHRAMDAVFEDQLYPAGSR